VFAEASPIGVKILDGAARHATFHRRLNDSDWHPLKEARIKGLRNDVVRAKLQRLTVISLRHLFRGLLLGEVDQTIRTGNFHFVVNRGRTAVERAAKKEGETQYVVDLIRKVRSTRANNGVGTRLAR